MGQCIDNSAKKKGTKNLIHTAPHVRQTPNDSNPKHKSGRKKNMWSKLVHLTLQGLDLGGQRLHLQGLGCNGLGLFSDEVFDLFDIVLRNGSWGSGGFGNWGRRGRDLRQLGCGAVRD